MRTRPAGRLDLRRDFERKSQTRERPAAPSVWVFLNRRPGGKRLPDSEHLNAVVSFSTESRSVISRGSTCRIHSIIELGTAGSQAVRLLGK